jgi:hypothetical protein
MKRNLIARYVALILLGILIALFKISGANGNAATADVHLILTKIFDYAKTHNVQALDNLRSEVETSGDTTLIKAYALALYMAAPQKYEAQYVEKFPVDSKGIMHDLYENIEMKRLTPRFLYSVEALGEIALKGNERAIEKIFLGVLHSDGAVSELFCDYTVKLFGKNLQSTLTALSRIDSDERKGTYECLKLMAPGDVAALKNNIRKVKTNDQKVLQVIEEIWAFQ